MGLKGKIIWALENGVFPLIRGFPPIYSLQGDTQFEAKSSVKTSFWPAKSLNQPKLALVHQSGRLCKEFSEICNLGPGCVYVYAVVALRGAAYQIYPWEEKNHKNLKKISKNFYPLKRAIRPDGAQLVEKNIFEIFGSSSCMLIYGISAYFGSIWQVGPFWAQKSGFSQAHKKLSLWLLQLKFCM